MSDIRFGTKWAHADYGLIVASYAIPMPESQTNFVEIPGARRVHSICRKRSARYDIPIGSFR